MHKVIFTAFLLLTTFIVNAQFSITETLSGFEKLPPKKMVTGGVIQLEEKETGIFVKLSVFKKDADIFPTMTIDVSDPYNTYETNDEFRSIFLIGEKQVKVVNRAKNNNAGRYIFQIAGNTRKAMKKGEFRQFILFSKDATEYTRIKLTPEASAYIHKMIDYCFGASSS